VKLKYEIIRIIQPFNIPKFDDSGNSQSAKDDIKVVPECQHFISLQWIRLCQYKLHRFHRLVYFVLFWIILGWQKKCMYPNTSPLDHV